MKTAAEETGFSAGGAERRVFKLMEERYRHHATILTTNSDYDEWPNLLGNRPMVEALLSRLRHYCHTVRIDGPLLRDLQG
jgi:DNA replication protein DnaC